MSTKPWELSGPLELLVRSNLLKALSQPYLDYGLSGDPQTPCLSIEGFDHPSRKIDIYPALFLKGPTSFRQIKSIGDIFTFLEL